MAKVSLITIVKWIHRDDTVSRDSKGVVTTCIELATKVLDCEGVVIAFYVSSYN